MPNKNSSFLKPACRLGRATSYKLQANSGQAFMDIIIAIGVFMILIHAIFSLVVVIYDTIGFTRTRLSARHLATEKMELALNLPFNELGTTTGIPNGILEEFETINRNGYPYSIHTTVVYVDDEFDQFAPDDLLPTDYKQIRIEVSWDNLFSQKNPQPVVLISHVAPKGVETSVGGGTLAVFVIDAMAQPLGDAQVHIVNDDIIPNVNITLETNSDGRVILPGAPACSSCYKITVTKEDYTTHRTYGIDEVAKPDLNHITVDEGDLSEPTFIIDRVSKLTIRSLQKIGNNYIPFPNNTFRLTGNNTIGKTIDDDKVYKFDEELTTNENGEYVIDDLEWDNYIFSIPLEQNQVIAGISPGNTFSIDPNQELLLEYVIENLTDNSLLISVKNASGSAIASVSAFLKKDPDFEASASTGLEGTPEWGQVFFSDLLTGEYAFTLDHSQYQQQQGLINIDGNIISNLILNEIE